MTAALLALAASGCWGFGDFLAGFMSRRVSVLAVLAVSQVAGLATALVIVGARGGGPPNAIFALWAALSGAATVVGLGAFYKGFSVGAMGIVAPIAATAPVLPLAVGLARGERPSALQASGMGLALVGVVLAARERSPEEARPRRLAAGAGFAVLAAACFGLSLLALAAASSRDPYWSTLMLRGASSLLVVAFVLTGRRRRLLHPAVLPLLVVGVLDTAGVFLWAVASTRGLVSIVAVLGSLYPVVIVLLARIVIAERIAPVQRAGALVALAGAGLIAAG